MPQFAHCPWWFALKPAKQSGFSKGPRHPHDRYVPARNMCRKYKVKSASALAEMACRVVTAPSRTEASKSAFGHPNLGNGPAIWEPVSPPPSNRSVLSAAPETCKLQPSKLHSTKSMLSKVSFSKDAGHGTIFETSPISKDYHSTINTSHRINLWDLLDNPLAFSHARPGDIALTSDVKNMSRICLSCLWACNSDSLHCLGAAIQGTLRLFQCMFCIMSVYMFFSFSPSVLHFR